MTARGDDLKLMHYLASQGYRIVKAASGHWKIRDENGVLLASTSGTPSDWRSRRNLLHDLNKRKDNDD